MKTLQFPEMLKKPRISSIVIVLKLWVWILYNTSGIFTLFELLEFGFQIKARFGKTDFKFSLNETKLTTSSLLLILHTTDF